MPAATAANGTFRSLRTYNFRLWIAGTIVSNIGTWMQETAQDWLVLTQLTHHNATALGIVSALQFGPHLLLLPWSGFAADRFDRRRLIMATQALLGALALGLGILTVTGLVQLWQVYVFAFLLGCTAAVDGPARQTFAADLVGDAGLSNAVSLNSTAYNAARMVGPAIAGSLIAVVGSGPVFLINAASFAAILVSLTCLRTAELHVGTRAAARRGNLLEGLRYAWKRPDHRLIFFMLFVIGTFGLNFPIFISAMAVKVFHVGSGRYGLLMSMMAVGTIAGALLGARRASNGMNHLVGGAAFFGVGCGLAAVMPDYWLFGIALVVIGLAALTFTNASNSLLQLSTEPAMRGRIMALRLAVALGGTPVGAPAVGWIADRFGARWALGVGALAGVSAALAGVWYLADRRSKAGRQALFF